ncbi:hypothetical protein GRJ2_002525500 [Grus japonensis]|uniref:Uncharacterized protein n=1 Tax=Grus japonensis TaxID=30415 RepID=A0ABC9XSB1_GRUJA
MSLSPLDNSTFKLIMHAPQRLQDCTQLPSRIVHSHRDGKFFPEHGRSEQPEMTSTPRPASENKNFRGRNATS